MAEEVQQETDAEKRASYVATPSRRRKPRARGDRRRSSSSTELKAQQEGDGTDKSSSSLTSSFMTRLRDTRWPCLCCYNELPDFQKENEWIHNGYRRGWSVRHHFCSVLYPFHNETVNIWTHLLGFIICAVAMGVLAHEVRNPKLVELVMESGETLWHMLEPVNRWPVYSFLAGAMTCLGGSAFAHSLNGVSQRSNYALWRLDYIGIVALIASSFFPPIYYGFMCHPAWKVVYLTTIISIAVSIVAMMFHSKFHHESWRMLRVWLFTGMGVSGIVPWFHSLYLHYQTPLAMQAASQMLMMGASYLGGVVFYAMRVPERWLPGKFDFAGNSHQIWHVAVLLGVFNHYKASMSLVEWRETDRNCLFAR